jgi:hypothetical protein
MTTISSNGLQKHQQLIKACEKLVLTRRHRVVAFSQLSSWTVEQWQCESEL